MNPTPISVFDLHDLVTIAEQIESVLVAVEKARRLNKPVQPAAVAWLEAWLPIVASETQCQRIRAAMERPASTVEVEQ